ncbi:hypothetical protein SJA_C1-29550 [Sphingobium indicum UT26S]|uniref:Uncharacterized protein n=1 Tax=Sphingobium indicum (strain DSM 16413 / CCM 7287 / MTCC 6362 / UT26 / NBRC 101211 / UT26S) TaxID=452662 RepID=D4Z5A7_SPHIU|nr:hypothetical protein SJA_C1-29550 [Sphingobium indicum UT26S]
MPRRQRFLEFFTVTIRDPHSPEPDQQVAIAPFLGGRFWWLRPVRYSEA